MGSARIPIRRWQKPIPKPAPARVGRFNKRNIPCWLHISCPGFAPISAIRDRCHRAPAVQPMKTEAASLTPDGAGDAEGDHFMNTHHTGVMIIASGPQHGGQHTLSRRPGGATAAPARGGRASACAPPTISLCRPRGPWAPSWPCVRRCLPACDRPSLPLPASQPRS